MSDVETLLRAYTRLYFACQARHVLDPANGRAVSARQAEVLSHLDEADPTMVGELAEHLGVTISTMSLTLKRLESAGYVRREREESDRRVMNVRLTKAGMGVRDAQEVLDPERVRRVLAEMDPVKRRAALEALVLLADAAEVVTRQRSGDADAEITRKGLSKGGLP